MEFFHTTVSPEAIQLANNVLTSTWLSEGKMVKAFEEALASKLGLVNPVAVNSGTAALHLALVLAGVGPDDEVILPAQTFVATGLVVLMQQARPVFADIDLATGNISVESIRQRITDRTKAILPVHWAGYPCDMDEINALADTHHLAVIEDAAHALGATYKGRPVGAISRFTAFSFQAIKHLTTGDGGAICCLEDAEVHRARALRWFGIDRANSRPSILGEREYDISEVGYKVHLNDLAAAVGLGNLQAFEQILNRRREIAGRYRQALVEVPGITLLDNRADRESAAWLFTLLVDRRTDFIRALQARGVPSSVVHLRIDHNSVFGGLTPDLPNQELFNEKQVSIPLHSGLSDQEVDQVIGAVKAGW
ncbi:MAG: DegT/DnrJ/EryC1/StrS family aminotransferase [Anaerolineae bacterium]|nr:DegT/DnrJ/EryC1/StrS family aminotransferase [Anaerolineae bacterium]